MDVTNKDDVFSFLKGVNKLIYGEQKMESADKLQVIGFKQGLLHARRLMDTVDKFNKDGQKVWWEIHDLIWKLEEKTDEEMLKVMYE